MSTSSPTFGYPLPQDVFHEQDQGNCRSLFETLILPAEVVAVEKLASSRTEADRKERRLNVIALRIVGYLLIHSDLFSHEARGAMERAIASCNVESNEASSHIKLSELGKFYLNHLIRPMRGVQGGTPVSSDPPSRSSFDTVINRIRRDIEPALTPEDTKAYVSSLLRFRSFTTALVRDGHCCMVTGCIDVVSWGMYRDALDGLGDLPILATQCCHIIPFSINNIKEDSDAETFGFKLEGTTFFWGILKLFRYDIQLDLKDEKINRLENLMTLSFTIHKLFGELNFWLEEVEGKENTYRTCLTKKFEDARTRKGLSIPPEVHFKVHDVDLAHRGAQDPAPPGCQSRHLALPNRKYLRLHAACCRVADLSGAAEYLAETYRDMEMLAVLETDGSSADILDAALWNI